MLIDDYGPTRQRSLAEAIDWLTIRPPKEGESSGEIDTATLIVTSGAQEALMATLMAL